jgi:hypothetical protein
MRDAMNLRHTAHGVAVLHFAAVHVRAHDLRRSAAKAQQTTQTRGDRLLAAVRLSEFPVKNKNENGNETQVLSLMDQNKEPSNGNDIVEKRTRTAWMAG